MTSLDKRLSLLFVAFWLLIAMSLPLLAQEGREIQPEAEQLMRLANQARAAAGVPPLQWDRSLAEAARKHTLRMASEGPIAHQYPGELNVSERAGLTGAHFDLIEENVAVAHTIEAIQDGWMQSKPHRENMLSPEVDSVGIAVVASRGVLYATADFSRNVQALTQEQVESRFSELIQRTGVKVLADHRAARAACIMDKGLPGSDSLSQPAFIMRWESSDVTHLPKQLADHLASHQFQEAAVGSCDARGDDGTFTSYRLAVLLY
ncbi:CAP domain-containing protein [Telmatobacter sp. DSM 110680]|uniref:CAP domain-containing protein n=1 Tax=Telmatobacter sp. DSM 110680 TaxID=3036704 RepID=A0AAU7DFM1_9BACT